jgi:hypothetical protein
MKTFVDALIMTVGRHKAEVLGLAPGVYVYKLEAEDYTEARKMVIIGSGN